MMRRPWLPAVLGLLLLSAGVALFLALFERVSVTVPLPPQGEARYNPLYALRAALRAGGMDARSYATLNPSALALGREDTLVLYTRPEAITAAQAAQLVAWVRAGGHLVMPSPGPGEQPGALADAFKLRAVDPDEGEDADADDAPSGGGYGCVQLAAEPAPPKAARPGADATKQAPGREVLSSCGPSFTSAMPGFRFHHGDSLRGYRFGRLDLGRGVVTVVSSLGFLDNGELRKAVARELAFQVLSPRWRQGAMHLVYSADVPSLWRLLMLHGWMALAPALLALLAWLAWRGQRLGPTVPPPTQHRRALLEHVQAAGEFAFQRGRGLSLHTAVLALFKRRLAVREPALAALEGETLVVALAERLDLAPERVRRALQPIGLQHPDVFLHSVSTLVQMRNRL